MKSKSRRPYKAYRLVAALQSMQPKEQRVILLDEPPNQVEYQGTRPKKSKTSGSFRSGISKGPSEWTRFEAIARAATNSMGPSEQQGHGRYQQADKTGLFPRTSTAQSTGSHLRQCGFPLRESRVDDGAFFLESGEDPRHQAGMIRTLNPLEQSIRCNSLDRLRPRLGQRRRGGPDDITSCKRNVWSRCLKCVATTATDSACTILLCSHDGRALSALSKPSRL